MNSLDPIKNDLQLLDNGEVFERIFAEYYGNLYRYAYSILKDAVAAEEVVQSVFCLVWEKRKRLRVQNTVKAYLFGCVFHECINWMRHDKKARKYLLHLWHRSRQPVSGSAEAGIEFSEMQRRVEDAIKGLPERCRAIFLLSRFGELGYKEIADQLGISIKTVEGQMSKALKHLRQKLGEFL